MIVRSSPVTRSTTFRDEAGPPTISRVDDLVAVPVGWRGRFVRRLEALRGGATGQLRHPRAHLGVRVQCQ